MSQAALTVPVCAYPPCPNCEGLTWARHECPGKGGNRIAPVDPEAVGFRAELWTADRTKMWFLDCTILVRGSAIEDIRFGEGWRRACELCQVPDALAEGWLMGEIARQAMARGVL